MPITPDTKDWTWVLERACPECGFDSRLVAPAAGGDLIRGNGTSWAAYLSEADSGGVRVRPAEDRWSGLEYACHVRDVFRLFDWRLRLMLEEDDPTFANWDQDETAEAERYAEQDPAQVGPDLVVAAGQLADRFDGVTGDQWERTGNRTDGARFTVATFARYLIHDPVHHLSDVGRGG